ncbi:hypothetical protein D9M68_1002930 [compost metagenome]
MAGSAAADLLDDFGDFREVYERAMPVVIDLLGDGMHFGAGVDLKDACRDSIAEDLSHPLACFHR